jgi:hypothetical protein
VAFAGCVVGCVVGPRLSRRLLDLADQVVGDRIGDAAAGGKPTPMIAELVNAHAQIGIGVVDVADRPTAGEEQQQAIDGDAAAGA